PAGAPAMPAALPPAAEPLLGLVPAVIPCDAVDEKEAARRAFYKSSMERAIRVDRVYALIEANEGRLPDDYDVSHYPEGAERWYLEDLLERRRLRAAGKEPPPPVDLRTLIDP
ncbi:MAG TPA: hypothetical protein VK943_14445, partial [Arenibaculum sp.]|nr:hypothetical protein [Arenibaculum sp.]